MSNLPILYFTLGMLAGLPIGYHSGPLVDAFCTTLRAIFGVLFGLRRLERDMAIFQAIVARGVRTVERP
jgi:hypothetical protein